MALFPLNPGIQPLGQFDVIDTDLASIAGGEVMTLTGASKTNTASELAAADALDGYDYGTTPGQRVAATLASTAAQYPLFLSDDGNSPDYFTMFGKVVGGTAGADVSGGAALGPHSATASGKVTLWDKPGLYSVTVDAANAAFVSGLAGTSGLPAGSVLGFDSSGKLAHGTSSAVASTGVATFLEFEGTPSLVATPGRLVGAAASYTRIKIHFHGGMGLRTVTTPS